MSQYGIDGVELKTIMHEAGARNRSAIDYHFGNREGLVQAIGAKHRPPINAARNRLLDRLGPDPTIDEIVHAAVTPLVDCLGTPSGRAYLIVAAEAMGRVGAARLHAIQRQHDDSARRVIDLLDQRLPGGPQTRHLLIGQMMLVSFVLLADVAREVNRGQITAAQAKRRGRTVATFGAEALHHRGDRQRM